MKTTYIGMASLTAVVCLWAVATGQVSVKPAEVKPAAAGEVKVVPASIEEMRSKDLLKGASHGPVPSSLTVKVHVTGPVAAKARRVGMLKFTVATDEKGTNLIDAKSLWSRRQTERMEEISKWDRREVTNGFPLKIRLKASSRQAAKIAKLTGSFRIQFGGTEEHVIVKDVGSLLGKTLVDAKLKAAGVKIKIVKPGGFMGGAKNQVCYLIEGGQEVILKVSLVDAAGKDVEAMGGSMSSGRGPRTHFLQTDGKLPDKAGLKVTILSGAKSVTVPLSLADIPLP